MPSRQQKGRIDAQWRLLQPDWGQKEYDGERKMLHGLLEVGEEVELLQACSFETKNVAWGSRHDRGVVVGTGQRVILLNRGRLSKNRFDLAYLEMDEITEPEPGRVRVRGLARVSLMDSEQGPIFDLDLQFGAAEFARFVRGHLLSDEESVAAVFSDVLELGEQVQHWAHCRAGEETVFHDPGGGGGMGGGRTPEYWSTSWVGLSALGVTTERRILFIEARKKEVIASCPHETILAVEHAGGQKVRFVDQGSQVYAAHFQREDDATPFVNIMQEHTAAAGQQVSRDRRISAQWKLQHPLWSDRDNHGGERRKLVEVLADDEQIEAMVWGDYHPQQAEEDLHSGIIAATRQRLLFVSNGWLDQYVSQMHYGDIARVDGGRVQINITATAGNVGYVIDDMDDMNAHHSREKGQVEEFAKRLKTLVDAAHSDQIQGPSPENSTGEGSRRELDS